MAKRKNRTSLSFAEFVDIVNPRYVWYRHCRVLADVLQRVAAGDIDRLMIFAPPRHGKSELVSRLFSAYYLYLYPDRFVGLNSYAAELAFTLSRNARENYRAFGGGFNRQAEAIKHWETTEGGGMWAAGVGGPITGKGFHCLPGDSLIHTRNGTIRIDNLIQLKDKPEVLSYNHEYQKYEWKRIIATANQPGKPVIEISLHNGNRMRCTADHFIYSLERGYIQARNIVPGETLVQISKIQDLQGMWNGYRAERSMQEVLSRGSLHQDSDKMCMVPEGIFEREIRSKKIARVGVSRFVLLKRMQSESSCHQESSQMREVQQANKSQNKSILRYVQAKKEENSEAQNMRLLLEYVSAYEQQNSLLLKDMCELRSLYQDEGQGKQSLQGRNKLCGLVQKNEARYIRAGQEPLCNMQKSQYENKNQTKIKRWDISETVKTGCASYRSRSDKQYTGESDSYVLVLSQKTSFDSRQWEPVTVSTVTRISEIPNRVYDIQIEENNNFFADKILVHNCGIIDDPLKNAQDAASPVIRESQKEWYRSTFSTREEPDGAIVIIQTRWNEDDLCGWLLSEEESDDDNPERWQVVSLEAMCDPEDKPKLPESCAFVADDWRQPGEALCPERYPVEKLAKLKRRIGSYYWSALYQQTPKPREGNYFKRSWFDIVGGVPAGIVRRIRWWDKAATDDPRADQTAGVLFSWHDDIYYIEDIVCGRWSSAERDRIILQTAQLDEQKYGPGVRYWQGQEPGSSGKDDALAFVRLLAGYSASFEPETGSKEVRADPMKSQAEVGNIKIVAGTWNAHFLDEITAFPTGKHDDQVDAASNAFNKISLKDKIAKARSA